MGEKTSRYLRNVGAAVLGSIAGTALGLRVGVAVIEDDPFGVILSLGGALSGVLGGTLALGLSERVLSRVERWWSWGSASPWFALTIIPTVIAVHMTVQGLSDSSGDSEYLLLSCVAAVAGASTAMAIANSRDWIDPEPGAPQRAPSLGSKVHE